MPGQCSKRSLATAWAPCLGDVRPRHFSGDDRQKLIELGKGVGAVLEMHRSSLWLLRV